MWQRLRLRDRTKYPLVDGETYLVRMIAGVTVDNEDLYDEFVCVWRLGLRLWIVKSNCDVYEWIDMDDVWVEQLTKGGSNE